MPDEVGARLEEIGGAKVVYLTHSDTSTGGVADVQATAARIAGSGALVAVDAISSLAAVPLETDDWGLDVVLTSSHKALMCPAGLAFAAISPAALEATETAALPRYYMDWRRAVTTQAKGETPVLDGDLARPRARRRARDDPRGRARGRARAAPPPRARRARRREGDGARPLLARRRHLRRRHGDPHAGRHRRAGDRRVDAGASRASRSSAARGRCAARSSASGTSATSTSTT